MALETRIALTEIKMEEQKSNLPPKKRLNLFMINYLIDDRSLLK